MFLNATLIYLFGIVGLYTGLGLFLNFLNKEEE